MLLSKAVASPPISPPSSGQREVTLIFNRNGGYGEQRPFPEIRDWRTLSIKLERGACFGTCPSYSVTLLGNGTVTYEGIECVAFKGRHVTHISQSAVTNLFAKFKNANFFSLRDAYAAQITDGPAYRTTISFDGHQKAVGDYLGGGVGMPTEVSQLEDAVDDVTGASRLASVGPRECFGRVVH